MKKIILIANGNYFDIENFTKIRSLGYEKIACADGGANLCMRYNIIPNYIIGDLDSISKDALEYFKDKSKIVKYKRQNDTDVEKALKYLINNKYDDIVLFSATGDRLDHSIGILSILLKFAPFCKLSMVHGTNILYVVNGNFKLNALPGETISLFAFNDNTKITTKGLKYPLKDETLTFGKRESISNVASQNLVEINISDGYIFLTRELKNL